MRRMISVRDAANLCRNCDRHSFSRRLRAAPSHSGPNQVIQRTEGEDNYYTKQIAGPTAARVLPYALLAEQAYDPSVYDRHRMAPRATGCIAGRPRGLRRTPGFEARGRLASISGATSGVATGRRPARCGRRVRANPLAVSAFRSGRGRARDVRRRSSRFEERSAATRETGNPIFTGSCALFPFTTNTIRSGTTSATSSAISSAISATAAGPTQITAVGHSLGGGLAQLAAYSDPRIRRVYAFDPSMVTGYYSVDPLHRDQNVKGFAHGARLRTRRDPRLRPIHHAAIHSPVALQSSRRQRSIRCHSWKSDRAAQPDGLRQRTASRSARPSAGNIANGRRAVRRRCARQAACRDAIVELTRFTST